MEKSAFAKNLDLVQRDVAAFLKPLGFRKKGRTHNRTTEGGLVHVVSFQMGAYPIGEHYEIPGLRENLYGKFTVNLGVLLPCIFEIERQQPLPPFVKEYDCSIRERLEALALRTDNWFDLTSDTIAVATKVVEMLDRSGLPFLEQFPRYEAALNYYDSHGDLPFQNPDRAALECGLVAYHLGDFQRSRELFRRADSSEHKGFREHVEATARLLGLEFR